MTRSLSLCFLALTCIAACDTTGPSPPPSRAAGTYSVDAIDGATVPVITPGDSGCQFVNSGGWLTLTPDRRYTMVLDRIALVCAGVVSGGTSTIQRGSFTEDGDSLRFVADTQFAPAFVAGFDPGTYTPATGGKLPTLTFTFVGRTYILIADGLIFSRQ